MTFIDVKESPPNTVKSSCIPIFWLNTASNAFTIISSAGVVGATYSTLRLCSSISGNAFVSFFHLVLLALHPIA